MPVEIADWRRLLLVKPTKQGDVLRAIQPNVTTILVHDPAWAGVLAYDEFAECVVTRKPPPWRPQDAPAAVSVGDWSDLDTSRLQGYLADAHGLDLGLEAILGGVKLAAERVRFHPIREWLQSLSWDGQRRARSWLVDVMGCEDTRYTREVGVSFLVSAVARAMRPGCKVDTVPILEGEQGMFKSSVIRALAGDDWFLEMSVTDVANKDAMQILRRKWIVEFPEWDGFSKADASHVKGYVSRQVDTYRESYGRQAKDYPRQVVFVGSTNKDQYLVDETGGRRFHPIKCRAGNVTRARELREQLWAEALAMYESGVPWHVVDPDLASDFAAEQDQRRKPHPWEEKIAAWLMRPIDLPTGKTRAELGVTTTDVLESALKLEIGKCTERDAMSAGACLRVLGWRPGKMRRRNGARERPYFPVEATEHQAEEQPSGVHAVAELDARRSPLSDAPTDAELGTLFGE